MSLILFISGAPELKSINSGGGGDKSILLKIVLGNKLDRILMVLAARLMFKSISI